MSNNSEKKSITLIILLMVFVSCLNTHELFAKQNSEPNGYDEKTKPQGEIYKLAKQTKDKNSDHVTLSFIPDRSVIAPNVRQLSRYSTEIIVGRVVENRSYLNNEGDAIHKYLTVLVQDSIKGSIDPGLVIQIQQFGGSWLYSDGLAVTWMPVGEVIAQDGKSYVFFLNNGKAEYAEHYLTTLGAQGVFELDFELDVIVPTDLNKRDPVVRKYTNVSITDFFDEINSVVNEEVSGF